MKDILLQCRRGIKSKGFLFAVILMLYALNFVHMDAGMFWTHPLIYFGDGDFYYTFIISTQFGLLWILLPFASVLPMGLSYIDDKQTRYVDFLFNRQTRAQYAAHRLIASSVISALAIGSTLLVYTLFLAIVCPFQNIGTGWQEAAMAAAYGWRASSPYFYVFILECAGRLMISAVFWNMLEMSLSYLWPNKTFVTVAVLSICLLLENIIGTKYGIRYTLSWLQAPDMHTTEKLGISLQKQLLYLMAAAVIYKITAYCRLSQKAASRFRSFASRIRLRGTLRVNQRLHFPVSHRGTFLSALAADIRSMCTVSTLGGAVLFPVICVFLSRTHSLAQFSVGDLLLDCFGGIAWFDPQVDFAGISRWVLILFPPMTGIALSLQRDLGPRALITIHRFRSKSRWWLSKSFASAVYTLLCVVLMFITVTLCAYAFGAKTFSVFLENQDGFMVANQSIIFLTFFLFLTHVFMLTQFQILLHFTTGDMQIGIMAYLIPLLSSLIMCSNIEQIWNVWIPYNWGMVQRSSLLCSSGYLVNSSDGSQLFVDFCAINPRNSLLLQSGSGVLFMLFQASIVHFLPITSRKTASV